MGAWGRAAVGWVGVAWQACTAQGWDGEEAGQSASCRKRVPGRLRRCKFAVKQKKRHEQALLEQPTLVRVEGAVAARAAWGWVVVGARGLVAEVVGGWAAWGAAGLVKEAAEGCIDQEHAQCSSTQ